jgi:hypothetical protein
VHRRLAAFLDKPADAATEIRALIAAANDREKVALGVWSAYYSEPALALQLLSDAAPRLGHPGVIWLPLFAGARSLPGFVELAQRMGMADYWRVYGYADFCNPVGTRIECR